MLTIDEDQLHLMEAAFDVPIQLDRCGRLDASYRVCKTCHDNLTKGKAPKFSAMNAANVTMCQDYPPELDGLTLMEECVIARSHPIGTILKLRPNGVKTPIAYNGIRGHISIIPQDPGPLLDILPSPDLKFYENIGVVWTGKTNPSAEDLKPFIEIRKDRVIRALLWLCQHNLLYKSVRINYDLINQWEDNFVPPILQEAAVNIPENEDSSERGTYAGDTEGLSENDLHNALDDMADGTIASGAVYSDVNGQRQSPELKMVNTLMTMMNKSRARSSDTVPDHHSERQEQMPVITWVNNNGRPALMNDYEDREYFTGAFPTLFPYGKGGHLPDPDDGRSIPISLEAWGKWLMGHHSRRYVLQLYNCIGIHFQLLNDYTSDSPDIRHLCTYYTM
jgi:hypothetical protein